MADGSEQVLASDRSWRWTRETPQRDGTFAREPTDWQTAAEVENQAFLGQELAQALRGQLAGIFDPQRPFVRASLVKSDLLMRSLGRPNREQVVTTRPAVLTTLQAIDLANGQTLADTLRRGAARVAARHGGSPEVLVEWLYSAALARQPTTSERTIAREILGSPPTPQGVEDLLWAVFMLPEFQLIR